MKLNIRFITGLLGFILLGYLIYKLQFVVVMILVAAAISLVLNPAKQGLRNIKIKKFQVSNSLATAIVFISFFLFLFLWGTLLLPLISEEVQKVSQVNISELSGYINHNYEALVQGLSGYGIEIDLKSIDFQKILKDFLSFLHLPGAFMGVFSTIGSALFAFFSICFIAFFFLKEDGLFKNMLLVLFPEKLQKKTSETFEKIKTTLGKYLIALMCQYVSLVVLYGIAMALAGNPSTLLIAVVGGLFSIIPYIGVVIVHLMSLLVILIASLNGELDVSLANAISYSAIALGVVQIIDAFISQPIIFSKSVQAHPLEIFLVIISAGYLGGIMGVILALPIYSALRIIAKTYFVEYGMINRLTKNI